MTVRMLSNDATRSSMVMKSTYMAEESLTADPSEKELVEVLEHHFGDGIVYVPKEGGSAARRNFVRAVELGYISEDGYLTRKGRALVARHNGD